MLKDIIIGLIIFALVVTGLVSFMVDSGSFYGTQVESKYMGIYKQVNKTIENQSSLTSRIQTKVASGERISVTEYVSLISGAAYEALRMPFEALATVTILMGAVANEIGIPSWILTGIMAILVTIIAFYVLSVIFKRNV